MCWCRYALSLLCLSIYPILCDHISLGTRSNAEEVYCPASKDSCGDIQDKSPVLFNSIEVTWDSLDLDSSQYLTQDEIFSFIKSNSEVEDEVKLNSTLQSYVNQLDLNGDTVVNKYELHYAIYDTLNRKQQESQIKYDASLVKWLRENFVGEGSTEIPFFLMKIFEIFDEDMNWRITWKEVRATILMSEIYFGVPEQERRDEPAREELLPLIKGKNDNKWLDMDEFTKLLEVLKVNPNQQYYEFLVDFLGDNFDYLSAPTSVKDEFVKTDSNLDGIISKGELIAALHRHRPGYYDDVRINHRFTRVDRNKDGKISFNEYLFLSNLKHPNRK